MGSKFVQIETNDRLNSTKFIIKLILVWIFDDFFHNFLHFFFYAEHKKWKSLYKLATTAMDAISDFLASPVRERLATEILGRQTAIFKHVLLRRDL